VQESGQWFAALSTGTSFTTQLAGAWTTSATWVDVLNGDFNGDGLVDIVGRQLESGQWWVALANGNGTFTTVFWDRWSPGFTWADIHAADVNGDGRADIVGRIKESGQWWVGLSNGVTGFSTSLWDAWSPSFTWADVQVGDLNGDGKADLLGRALENGQWWAACPTAAPSRPACGIAGTRG